MYTQNFYRQQYNVREESKNNFSHTGQMAIGNPNGKQVVNQIQEYQRNNPLVRQDPMDMNGIQNQLALLKQKMARGPEIKQRNEDILDQQTSKLNDQLNNLNQRLQQKQYPPSQIPRYRGIPQMKQSGFDSTNNTNFSYQQNGVIQNSNVQNSLNKLQSYQPVAYKQLSFQQQQALKSQQEQQQQPQNQMSYQPSMMQQQSLSYQPSQKSPLKQPQQSQQIQISQPQKIIPQQQQKKLNAFEEQPAVATKKNEDQIEEYNEEQLFECPEGCGRQFNQKALQKHVKVCKQVFQTKREEYDSKQARLVNQEQEKLEKQGKRQEKIIKQRQVMTKQKNEDPKWKKQSENFRKMLQATKNGGEADYEEYQDLTECPSCGRKFNDQAAKRHIPLCKEKQKRIRMK